MKPSDSTNSLTGLTSGEKSCFICLSADLEDGEPLVDSKLLRSCGCIFAVHPACWNQWMKDKSDYDCPICRKASMLRIKIPPNPVLVYAFQEERVQSSYKKSILFCCIFSFMAAILVTSIILWG
jgi:hypothetical protein